MLFKCVHGCRETLCLKMAVIVWSNIYLGNSVSGFFSSFVGVARTDFKCGHSTVYIVSVSRNKQQTWSQKMVPTSDYMHNTVLKSDSKKAAMVRGKKHTNPINTQQPEIFLIWSRWNRINTKHRIHIMFLYPSRMSHAAYTNGLFKHPVHRTWTESNT